MNSRLTGFHRLRVWCATNCATPPTTRLKKTTFDSTQNNWNSSTTSVLLKRFAYHAVVVDVPEQWSTVCFGWVIHVDYKRVDTVYGLAHIVEVVTEGELHGCGKDLMWMLAGNWNITCTLLKVQGTIWELKYNMYNIESSRDDMGTQI